MKGAPGLICFQNQPPGRVTPGVGLDGGVRGLRKMTERRGVGQREN